MNKRQQAIATALQTAGCTCTGLPTWTWLDGSVVRCRCGVTAVIDTVCPTCHQPLPAADPRQLQGDLRT